MESRISEWNEDPPLHLEYFLCESVVRYWKKDGEDTSPGSMKGYIFGVQRYLCHEWGYNVKLTESNILDALNMG